MDDFGVAVDTIHLFAAVQGMGNIQVGGHSQLAAVAVTLTTGLIWYEVTLDRSLEETAPVTIGKGSKSDILMAIETTDILVRGEAPGDHIGAHFVAVITEDSFPAVLAEIDTALAEKDGGSQGHQQGQKEDEE
ncbi:hypothetical protein JDF658_21640 [Carboxydocella sp. JDF658]|nr:hypothetical protein JDF658_21640 [Carboxydocella sp. JDF658]